MPGRTPGRALACLLLVLAALGVATPSARAEGRVVAGSATVVQDHGRTTTAARTRALTRAVAVPRTSVREALTAEARTGSAGIGTAVHAGVVGSSGAAGASGSGTGGAVGALPAAARPLAPRALGQLPRPPSSSYASVVATGSPSRAPPAAAGT